LPLFDSNAWDKANNVLKEILDGNVSDPPGIDFYVHRLDSNGDPKFDKLGLALYDCNRGTNMTENVHKQLNYLFGSWSINIEFSDKLTAEFRHRYNQNMARRRRLNYPKIGHFDTWLVDELVNLVEHNHGVSLFEAWVKPSSFGDTDEKLGTIPLHSSPKLQEAFLKIKLKNPEKLKLTRDMKYLSERMGIPYPVVPVRGEVEFKLFNTFMMANKLPYDFDEMAIAWCEKVDCIHVFPKLPVYLSSHFNTWQHNNRIREATKKAMNSKVLLGVFNEQTAATVFEKRASSDGVPQPKPIPPNPKPNDSMIQPL
jgi:hypothetical protein